MMTMHGKTCTGADLLGQDFQCRATIVFSGCLCQQRISDLSVLSSKSFLCLSLLWIVVSILSIIIIIMPLCYACVFFIQFATVYKARDKTNDTIVAIKKVLMFDKLKKIILICFDNTIRKRPL